MAELYIRQIIILAKSMYSIEFSSIRRKFLSISLAQTILRLYTHIYLTISIYLHKLGQELYIRKIIFMQRLYTHLNFQV